MSKNIFISYSRREVGFVDALADHLETKGFTLWLDYRNLVPGKPWVDQINQGIAASDTVLLVVSQASMESDNVEFEWRQVLDEKKKRIILLIFEAVDLPVELEKFEWVDFRANYQSALRELERQLGMPEKEEHPVPQTGFKVPAPVWLAFGLSLLAAIFSIGAIWTLFIPFFLIPLPYRILKRNFNYSLVQASLVTLPLAIWLAVNFTVTEAFNLILSDLWMVSIPFAFGLAFLLRSPALQRWGKPEAVAPARAQKRAVEYPPLKPVSFYVEHAPEDNKIAAHIQTTLQEAGHVEAADPASANSVFTLVSRFKSDSVVDCDNHVVYPVIVQSNNAVSRQLSRLQWLDLRTGVKDMDVVARMLPAPDKLLRSLGIRPMGNQLIMPSIILHLAYFITLLAVVCIGSWFPYILQYADDFIYDPGFTPVIGELTVSLILFGTLAYFMAKHLVDRKGLFASLPALIVGMLTLGGIILWQIEIDYMVFDLLETTLQDIGYSSYYPYRFYLWGNALMLVYLFIKRKNLMYWFPSKKRAG